MPIYEYECVDCKYKFEEFKNVDQRNIATCPKCNSLNAKLLVSRSQPLIKGSWKGKPDSHPLDGGIPFGEAPGDDDYKDIDNPLNPKP